MITSNQIEDAIEQLGPCKPLVIWVNKKSAKIARRTWGQCIMLQVWDMRYNFPDDMTRAGTLFLSRRAANAF